MPTTAPGLQLPRGFAIAGGLHLVLAAAALGLVRLHLPQAPPDAPVITVVMETTPQGNTPSQAAKPLPMPPPPVPVAVAQTMPLPPPLAPAQPMPQPRKTEARARAVPALARPASASRPAAQARRTPGSPIIAHDIGSQVVAVSRPASADTDNAAPVYTMFERELGEQGTVRLKIVVSPSGVPASVTVVATSGFRVLDAAARRAVLGWHFQPAIRRGVAVASTLPYVIAFVLQ